MAYDLSRVAPVQSDLTKEDLGCQIIRGYTQAQKVNEKVAVGVSLVTGEWGVKTADGMVRPAVESSNMSLLVIGGLERFDAIANKAVTCVEMSSLRVKTDKFALNGQYSVGVELTVRNLGAGEACVSPAATGDFVVAKVVEAGNGYIVYDVLPVIVKKA